MLILAKDHPLRTQLSDEGMILTRQEAHEKKLNPLRIGFINLEPNMLLAELRNARMFCHSPLPVEMVWIHMTTHKRSGRNVNLEHVDTYYSGYFEVQKSNPVDGLIISGASERIEKMKFEEIDYWEELRSIYLNVAEQIPLTMYHCWSVSASMYTRYGVQTCIYPQKIAGIVKVSKIQDNILINDMDDEISLCHSRNIYIYEEDINLLIQKGEIVALYASSEQPEALNGEKIGCCIFTDKHRRSLYNFGHIEYLPEYIANEVQRDRKQNPPILYPVYNYYTKQSDGSWHIPEYTWRSAGRILYENFINECHVQKQLR
ncbi:MAG: homoserine O-succinyltransferase [Candidatus Roizmanbacteria bacterium]